VQSLLFYKITDLTDYLRNTYVSLSVDEARTLFQYIKGFGSSNFTAVCVVALTWVVSCCPLCRLETLRQLRVGKLRGAAA
jgi:hypothetical protein